MSVMEAIPSLALLRSFEAAARRQSFTAAAEELRVTQGAVSRQVRELESSLGVQLFRPAGRGVALTDAGEAFANRLRADLDRLRQSIVFARAAGESARVLSIGVLPTFSSRWLTPRLPKFRALYPDVRLAIHSRTTPFDLVEQGVDLAIHFGPAEWVGGALSKLCPENLAAVASPELASRCSFACEDDVQRLPLLHLMSRRSNWPDYFHHLGLDPRRSQHGDLFEQFSAMIAAAISGLGAAIVPTFLIETELSSGALRVLGRPNETTDMYHVVTPLGVGDSLVASFKDWLCLEARASTQARMLRDGVSG